MSQSRRQSQLLRRLDIQMSITAASPPTSPGRPNMRRTRRMSMASSSRIPRTAAPQTDPRPPPATKMVAATASRYDACSTASSYKPLHQNNTSKYH